MEGTDVTREETVAIRTTNGGAVAFSAGQKYGLVMAVGEIATQWSDGSPITRGEFEDVLAPHGPFMIHQAAPGAGEKASTAAESISEKGE